jgi:hypothetical protein
VAHLQEDALRFVQLVASQEAAVCSAAFVPLVHCAVIDEEHSEVLGLAECFPADAQRSAGLALAGCFPTAAERSAVPVPVAHSAADADHSAAFPPAG